MRKYVLAALVAVSCALAARTHAQDAGAAVRVGIPQTFFHDLTAEQIKTLTEPFVEVMKESTGLTGVPVTGGDPLAVAEQVHDKKLALGVFYANELAWARTKFPELKTLTVALDTKDEVRGYVVVPKDGPVKAFADLKGKRVAVPSRAKDPVRLFADRLAAKEGAADLKAFAEVAAKPGNAETTLNALALRKFDAALVDTQGLEFYKDLQPGLFAKLRVLATSEPFPPAVIAYQPGVLPEAVLKLVANGLRDSAKTDAGQDMMKLWRIRGFAPVPADYEQQLAATLKAYPPPTAK